MKRTTLSLIAAVVALVAVTGIAKVTAPGGTAAAPASSASKLPVQRSTMLCPSPGESEVADTSYTSLTPGGGAASGSAVFTPAAAPPDTVLPGTSPSSSKSGKGKGAKPSGSPSASASASPPPKPVLTLKAPGTPVTTKTGDSAPPALLGTATGSFAPGWTTQMTTTIDGGNGRGLLGVDCTAPDTDFWFPGASTASSRSDYVYLTNPDDGAAVVDVDLYGPEGELKSQVPNGIPVPGHTSVPVLLSTLTGEAVGDLTVHVTTRSGRVSAAVRASDDATGSDWLPAAADPATTVVMPGIPKDATDVRLVVLAPGGDDADLGLHLAESDGTIVPAGTVSLHAKAGMTTAVDLKDVTKGDAGTLILSPSDSAGTTPVVAALRVTRGKGDNQEIAFIPATAPVTTEATAADNRAKGSVLTLTSLAAKGSAPVQVRVTASAGTGGGTGTQTTYTLKPGTSTSVTPPVPHGLKGSYALTVEPQGGHPVYAARMLEVPQDGIPMFTVQTLPDDRGTVAVPRATQDLSILDDQN